MCSEVFALITVMLVRRASSRKAHPQWYPHPILLSVMRSNHDRNRERVCLALGLVMQQSDLAGDAGADWRPGGSS